MVVLPDPNPLLKGVGAPHQCPRENQKKQKTKWMRSDDVTHVPVVGVVGHAVCLTSSYSNSREFSQPHPIRAEQDSASFRWRAMPVPQPVLMVVHCLGYVYA